VLEQVVFQKIPIEARRSAIKVQLALGVLIINEKLGLMDQKTFEQIK
jgi:hypothetical protein